MAAFALHRGIQFPRTLTQLQQLSFGFGQKILTRTSELGLLVLQDPVLLSQDVSQKVHPPWPHQLRSLRCLWGAEWDSFV